MRSPYLLSLAVIGLSATVETVSPLRAQTPAPYVCMTRDFTKRIAYVSPIFNVRPADALKVNPAWNQVMTSQYGITALPSQSCQGPYPRDATADSARARFIAYIQTTMKQKVVELTWTYAGVSPVTVAPPPPPTAPPPAPPPAVLTAADRQAAQAEIPQAKGYCQQNYEGLFDCDCFAQAVLHHRLAHPEEWITDQDGRRRPPIHDLAVGIQYTLDCTECLEDERLMSWARKTVSAEFGHAVMSNGITQAKVDAYADCVAKAFPARFRANPYLHRYLSAMNEARVSCGNPRG